MTLVLVRHGATDWSEAARFTSRTDRPLSSAGRVEARQAASALRARLGTDTVSRAWSSPALRCLQTVEALAAEVPLPPPSQQERLRELWFGDAEGLTRDEMTARWPDSDFWGAPPPDAESAHDVAERLQPLLVELRSALQASAPALVVGHGYALRVLAAVLLGLPAAEGRLFGMRSGAVVVLEQAHGRTRLLL